jgi:uncharacterized protein YggE
MKVQRAVVLAGVVALATLGVACSEPAPVEVQAPLDRGPDVLPDGITVSGEGEVEGAPDTLSADLAVSVKRSSVGEAVAASAGVSTAVVDAVSAQGVAEEDVQTRSYTVNQEFRFPEGGSPVPDGYRVNNTVTVRVRDLPSAGAVIDAAVAAGGDDLRIDRVAFSLENDGPALTAARERAFRDAQTKARQYAELADQPLGGAQAISDVVVSPQAQQFFGDAAARAAFAASDGGTPIQPGEVTTRVTVNTRFTLA